MDTIVSTRAGQVRGRTIDGVSAFLGVSYAAPPVGAGRLRPPRPVEPWIGVRDALVLGPEPPQPQSRGTTRPGCSSIRPSRAMTASTSTSGPPTRARPGCR